MCKGLISVDENCTVDIMLNSAGYCIDHVDQQKYFEALAPNILRLINPKLFSLDIPSISSKRKRESDFHEIHEEVKRLYAKQMAIFELEMKQLLADNAKLRKKQSILK